ncbi:MAG TPA: DUF3365 domain-containing protein [Saprospiraceae bacterium]|nr:DUF3365 domain-containing protein [Saprospiraceae bacterium]
MKQGLFIWLSVLFVVSCQNGLSTKEKEMYLLKGQEIAKATAGHLGGEVKKKMGEGGVAKAVPFCNANADGFTEEMAKKYQVLIRRTSDKFRNEHNAPNPEELTQIKRYRALLDSGKKLTPIVEQDTEGKVHFYAPIKVQKKCLSCHGVLGETMEHKADSIIKFLYPKDKAIGFKEDDLRGIWSIEFRD